MGVVRAKVAVVVVFVVVVGGFLVMVVVDVILYFGILKDFRFSNDGCVFLMSIEVDFFLASLFVCVFFEKFIAIFLLGFAIFL